MSIPRESLGLGNGFPLQGHSYNRTALQIVLRTVSFLYDKRTKW
jgi:hypothetical protein